MKVLLINTFYNQESTGKLMHNFRLFLKENNIEVKVLYGHGPVHDDPDLIRLSSDLEGKLHNAAGRITGMNGCFSPLATDKALKEINAFRPDVIYLGNLHGHYINIYKLYDFLRSKQIPVVQIMWDEYSMTGACAFSYDCEKYKGICGNCEHKKDYPISLFFDTARILQKKKEAAYKNQTIGFLGVPYTAEKAKQSSLLRGYPVYSVDEAVDQINLFYPRDPSIIRSEFKISNDKTVVLNVCPYPSIRKGGKYYLELARKSLNDPDVIFIHVGFKGNPSECPDNFIPVGYVSDQNRLAAFYSAADLFVCTSLAETQPNTCLEALSCGTPICGFDISGVPTCAVPPYGQFVPFKDTDALRRIVLETPHKTDTSIQEIRAYARSRFSSEDYNKNLLRVGKEIMNRN